MMAIVTYSCVRLCRAVYTQRYFRDLSHAIAKTKIIFFGSAFVDHNHLKNHPASSALMIAVLIVGSNWRWALVCHHFGGFIEIGLVVWCDGISSQALV